MYITSKRTHQNIINAKQFYRLNNRVFGTYYVLNLNSTEITGWRCCSFCVRSVFLFLFRFSSLLVIITFD